jgi:hypothetical protein
VRDIYTDEAGTSPSPHEQFRVVVALIVHADTQWFPALGHLGGLLKSVPAEYRKGFEFHAKDLYAENKYPNWDYDERKKLMREVMAIPDLFNVPIAVAAIKKKAHDWTAWPDKKMSATTVDHFMAFVFCMCAADYYIRRFCGIELARVTADTNQTMRTYMQQGLDMARLRPLMMEHTVGPSSAEIVGELKVERIVDEIHFTDGFRAPFLQIADACAFAFRRAFSEQREGNEFVNAVLGDRYKPVDTSKNTYLELHFRTDEDGNPWKPSDEGLFS